MCGIAGRIVEASREVSAAELSEMQSSMHHRGPNGGGTYLSPRVGLTMRRLSIIDVVGGDQPLYNENKNVVVIGNGEIYNYKELQKELKKRGHYLKTKSDIETIAHLYEDLGLNFVEKLRGMFALAIYDKKHQRVILVRDRLGEKPLYWTKIGRGLAFASEMKVIVKLKGVKKRLNWAAIDRYFHYYYIPEPETMFAEVHKLPPAHLLTIDLNTMTIKKTKYWRPEEIEPDDESNPTEKIREVFSESCRLTLRSDVPVGIALSGGIDSGSILSLAAPVYRKTMKAFSIGYEGVPASDERKKAKWLAGRHGVEFIEEEIKSREIVDYFPQLVYDGDDPIADIAGLSIHSVSKLARENNVPVLLGGLGGDELFWGYTWMPEAVQKSLQARQMRFYDLNAGFQMAEEFIRSLYAKEFASQIDRGDSFLPMRFAWRDNTIAVAKNGMGLIRDLWLVSNCIDLNDRLSMANSIELRSPFLDYKLVELIMGSRKAVTAYNKPLKYWLKRAMKGILPTEVMNRPKQGFTPPVSEWVKGILGHYLPLVQGGFLIKEKILNPKKIEWLTKTWFAWPMYWYALYQIVLLEIWGREYYYDQDPRRLR